MCLAYIEHIHRIGWATIELTIELHAVDEAC